jgi:hypothetical protein
MNKMSRLMIGAVAMTGLVGCEAPSSPVPVTINNASSNPVGLSATSCQLSIAGNGDAVTACDNGLNFTVPAAAVAALGTPGPTGSQGPAGATGAAGAQGIQGIQGIQGLQGLQGAVGPTGATGAAGPQGAVGPTGATGSVGPQGPQGVAGNNGTNAPKLVAKDLSNATINALVTHKSTTGISLWDNNNDATADYDSYGNIVQANIYWNGSNCTGTPYMALPPQTTAPAPGIFYAGVGAVVGDNSSHQFQVTNTAINQTQLGYMSMQTAYAGACTTYGTQQHLTAYYSIQLQSYSGVLPKSIALPLSVQ